MFKKFTLALSLVVMVFSVSLTVHGGETKPLIAGADISYPPFEYKEGNTAVGFDVDLWKEIGKRIGRPTKHENFSWDGLIPGLLANKFDVIMSDMGITEQRKKMIAFSIPYFKQTFGIVVPKNSSIEKLEDLNSKIVGIQTGTMAEKWLRDHEKKLGVKKIIAYDVMPDGILDLQAGRIDAVTNDRPFLAFITKNKDDIYLIDDLSFGDDIFIGIAFRPGDVELRNKVNKAIEEIIADGTYSKIYAKWFGREPSKVDMPF